MPITLLRLCFARLFGGFARGGGINDLLDDRAGMGGIFLKPFRHLVRHQAFQRLAHFGGDELVFGLRRRIWDRAA